MASAPKIACLPNGPYYLLNDPAPAPVPNLRRSSGEACVTARGVALCRCGGSKNKPFCDGTHSAIGFSDRKISDGSKDRRESYAGKGITIFDNRGICAHAGYCSDGAARKQHATVRFEQGPGDSREPHLRVAFTNLRRG